MKEATGELNIAVVVILIVAVLSFFFFSIIWPSIRNNFDRQTKCDDAICLCPKYEGNKCVVPDDYLVTCYYYDNNGNKHDITCAWKG